MMRWAALLALACTACSQRTPTTDTAAPAGEGAAPEAPAVTLERTPCFGTCPVYRVTISQSGDVRYLGKRHVARQGEATGRIPAARVDSLVQELKAAGYFGFADEYVMNSPACGMYATDSPMAITSLTTSEGTKRVRHDYGCHGAPQELGRLERRIDEVAGTQMWIGGR